MSHDPKPTKPTHTPGPWTVARAKGEHLANNVVAVSDSEGCTIVPGVYCTDGEADTAVANARLIAAAPEMLEALQAIAELSAAQRKHGDRETNIGHDSNYMKRIRAAIAKATGA